MTKFDRIYLDLDGPLLDCRRRHHRVFCDLLVEAGAAVAELPTIDELWNRKRSGASTVDLALEACPSTDAESLGQSWLERIERDDYLSLDELQPLAQETLVRLQARGYGMRLITARRNRDGLRRQLSNLALDGFFGEIIVVSPNGLESKHEPLRSDVAGFGGTACLVGDSEMDMSAARAGGLIGLGVDCGIRVAEALLAAGAREVRPRLASYMQRSS